MKLPLATALWILAAGSQPALAVTPPASVGHVLSAGADSVGIQGGIRTPLKTGAKLYPNERIETGKDPLIVLLRDGTVSAAVKLKPDTHIQVDASPGRGIHLQLESGALLSDVHNPEKRSHPFAIHTRTAVMGVRGTVFFVKEDPGKSVFLCTCHGEVAASAVAADPAGAQGAPAQADEEILKGKHHDHPVLIQENTAGPIAARMTPTPMGSEHSDAESAELEAALSGLK